MPQVLISFDINEEKIAENIEKEAGRRYADEVIKSTFGSSYSRESAMREYIKSVIREMLEPKKDEIIGDAISEVVGNLHRTKAVKEKLEQL